MAEKQRMYMMVCWRSPSNWFFFSWPFSFPTLTRALLSCLAQFLLRHLFICACCSTALLRQTPAPPACAPSCPQAVWMWQAQPFTWAGIPGLFELGISSGSGTANSSLAALASWEGTRGKRVPVWKRLVFCVAVSHCWVTLNLLPCLRFYTEWYWVQSLPAHHELLLELFATCFKCVRGCWDIFCVWRPLQFLTLVICWGFLNLVNWKIILFHEKYFLFKRNIEKHF